MKFQQTTANYEAQGLYFSGRWAQTSHGMYTTNLGARIITQVQGTTTVQWSFSTKANAGDTWLAYQIDDQPFERLALTDQAFTVTLPDEQSHVLQVVYSGNSTEDNVWKRHQGLYFDQVQTTGQLQAVKPAGTPLVFVGDSITAGSWVAGTTPGQDYRAESNYAALVAEHFNREDIRICYPGTGVVKPGTGGVPNAQTFVDHLADQIDWQPDFQTDDVIVNLGTPDKKINDNDFRVGFEVVLQKLKLQYPKSRLWVMIPFSQNHADVIREETPEYENTRLIETKDWDLTFTDGMHPDLAGSQKAADYLIQVLQPTLG